MERVLEDNRFRKTLTGTHPCGRKKSIFWELPYWKVLEVRSAIDVMHVTNNVCLNLLGYLVVYGKKKDTEEAREDQKRVKERDGLVPNTTKVRPATLLPNKRK